MENNNIYVKLKDNQIGDRKNKTLDKSEKANKKLIIVCIMCSVFMAIEFIGGLMANSIAIMTDAAHLLSDLLSFIISIVALYYAKFPADKKFTYGYHRSEVLGALISITIVWILTVLLLSESIQKLYESHHPVKGDVMLITSTIGLVFNMIMAYVLHSSVKLKFLYNNFKKLNAATIIPDSVQFFLLMIYQII
jgi:zinc transporter 2